MLRPLLLAAAFSVGLAGVGVVQAQSELHRSALHDFNVVTVVDGLEVPWSMAWLPNGDMLVTERAGRLRIVRDGQLLPEAVPGVPEVFTTGGQAGLFDVLPHPNFEDNQYLYLSFAKPQEERGASTTTIVRGRLVNDRLEDVTEIFAANAAGAGHYGGRIIFDDEGYLFASLGDRMAPPRGDLSAHPAQDLSNHHGVIVRLNDDGSVPEDNPFVGEDGVEPAIWSYGHRSPQGLAQDPVSGKLWMTEHGPQGGDEVNLVQPGKNYGWPVVGRGLNYGPGTPIHESIAADGMENPAHFWVPSIAASGLAIYNGSQFPEWSGDLFAGGLAGEQLARLTLNEEGTEVMYEETLLPYIGRIRDVRVGPDGYIYVAIESRSRQPTPIVRLEPAN
ncbi:MAG: PQQ-dependent sugar dehydrogenase [Pseudohongiellaceae bacterium]|nr:PQQ-dependent sugar dehydrogenase [Pseudohongiellaceae bacterium]